MTVSEQGCVVTVKQYHMTCVIDFNKLFVSSAKMTTSNDITVDTTVHLDGEGAGVHIYGGDFDQYYNNLQLVFGSDASAPRLTRAFGYFFSYCTGDPNPL